MILGSVLLALAGLHANPTVHVDIDALALPHAQVEQLHGELMTRLLEAGHPVGSPGVVTVRVVGSGTHVHVEAQHGRVVVTRELEGEGGLLRLAVIHAVLELLGQLHEQDGSLESLPWTEAERSVVVRLGPGTDAALPSVVRALVEGGHVVTRDAEDAAWVLCVELGEDGGPWMSAALVGDEACPPVVAGGASLAEALASALTSAERIAASTEAEAEAEAEAELTPDPLDGPEPSPRSSTPLDPPPDVSTPAPRPLARSRWRGALGAGAGIEARITAPEALLLVHGDARHDGGGQLGVRLSVAPSGGGPVRAADTWITASGGWAWNPTERLRIELLAAAGVAVHAYAVGPDRGARADLAVELPWAIVGRVGRRWELGVAPFAGWSSRARRHRVDGEIAWARSAWRVGGAFVVRVVLPWETSGRFDG